MGVQVASANELQQAITAHGVDTTFCLSPGIYRINATLTVKTGQKLIGAGDPGTVVISGAKVANATLTSGRWVITGQRTLGKSSFSGTSNQCRAIDGRDPDGMCVFRDQVFLDDVSLWQVRSLNDLSRGEFFWNYSTNKIYLADDPTGRALEVSRVGGRAIMGGFGVMIQNLVVEKFGTTVGLGALSANRNWTILDSELRLNHGAGVHVAAGNVLRGTSIHHNGQLGIHGGQPSCSAASGIVVEDNEIAFNNAAGYNWSREGGASKWTNTAGLIVRNNLVHHNYGMGLWTDGANANVLVEGNVVEDNAGSGIDHELGQAAIIRDNQVRRNGFAHSIQGDAFGAGIFIDQSRDVEIYGNVVEDNAAGIAAVQEPAGSICNYPRSEVTNLFVHDNIVRQPRGIAAGLRLLNESGTSYFSLAKNNRFESNRYVLGDPTNGLHFKWRGAVVGGKWEDRYTVADWVRFGHDETGAAEAI
jgi:hypothetical protein